MVVLRSAQVKQSVQLLAVGWGIDANGTNAPFQVLTDDGTRQRLVSFDDIVAARWAGTPHHLFDRSGARHQLDLHSDGERIWLVGEASPALEVALLQLPHLYDAVGETLIVAAHAQIPPFDARAVAPQ